MQEILIGPGHVRKLQRPAVLIQPLTIRWLLDEEEERSNKKLNGSLFNVKRVIAEEDHGIRRN